MRETDPVARPRIVVVGGGLAGLAVAVRAARAGARVTVSSARVSLEGGRERGRGTLGTASIWARTRYTHPPALGSPNSA